MPTGTSSADEIGLKGEDEGLGMKAPWDAKKETKTAEELAAMILQDLSNVEGLPQANVMSLVRGAPLHGTWALPLAQREAGL